MTKHVMRPPVGSGMEISEDTNAAKEIYDRRWKLMAGFRLGGSVCVRQDVERIYGG